VRLFAATSFAFAGELPRGHEFWGMALAGIWAVGEYPLQAFVNLEQMARYHGVLNSVALVCDIRDRGLVGVAIKHNLDRLIASSFLGYKSSFNERAPLEKAARLDHSPSITSTLCGYDSRSKSATRRGASVLCKPRKLALGSIGLEGECRNSMESGRVALR